MPRLPTSLTGGRRSPKGGPVSSGEPQAGLKSGRLRGTSEDQKIYVCACVCAGASAGNSSRQPQTQPICTDTNPVTTQSMEDDEDEEGGGEREREGGWEGGRERTKRCVSVRGITCKLLETSALKCQLLLM